MNNDRFQNAWSRAGLLLTLFTASVALTACGGSSSGSSKNSSSSSISSNSSSYSASSIPANGTGDWPSVRVSASQIKTLRFEWSPVADATYYILKKNPDGISGYEQVGGTITDTFVEETVGAHIQDWINAKYIVEACNASGCNSESDIAFTATEMLGTIGYIKSSAPDRGDSFGWSIAISGDGSTLAVGAPAEDSNATGINGDDTNNTSTNAGAVYVFTKNASGQWMQQAYVKASNTEQLYLDSNRVLFNDRFGYRVSLSHDGNTLAVSALLEDSPSYGVNCNQDNYEAFSYGASSDPSLTTIAAQNFNVGAVYMFERTNAAWAQTAYIKPRYSVAQTSLSEGLRFGQTLALSGDGLTLAVGSPNDSLPTGSIVNFYSNILSGSASSLACLEYYPTSSSSSSSSSSLVSSSVSSGATTSAIGGSLSGAVYLYRKTDSGWTEDAYVRPSNSGVNDQFSYSIDLSFDGNVLAVGAPYEDSISVSAPTENGCYRVKDNIAEVADSCKNATGYLDVGSAYIFTRNGNDWSQTHMLKPDVIYIQNYFGFSVALSGDASTLAVGALNDSAPALGLDSNPSDVSNANIGIGAVWVYGANNGAWIREAFIKPEAQNQLKQFGGVLALSRTGDLLAVGAHNDDSLSVGINGDDGNADAIDSGAVFMYSRHNGVWAKTSYVKAPNTGAQDRFGQSISLSADGQTLAVGAPREQSNAKGIENADQTNNELDASGAAYLY